jgi:hypothetical protein
VFLLVDRSKEGKETRTRYRNRKEKISLKTPPRKKTPMKSGPLPTETLKDLMRKMDRKVMQRRQSTSGPPRADKVGRSSIST